MRGMLHGQVSDFVVVLLPEVGAISHTWVTAEESDFHSLVLFLLECIVCSSFFLLSYLPGHFVTFFLEATFIPCDWVNFVRHRVHKGLICTEVSQPCVLTEI